MKLFPDENFDDLSIVFPMRILASSLNNLARLKNDNKNQAIEYQADTDKVNIIKDRAPYRAEREQNLSHFRDLLILFRQYADPVTGLLSIDSFVNGFREAIGELTNTQLELLFMKIDIDTDNFIDWDDFSTYMLLRAKGKKEMMESAEQELFTESSRHIATGHKEMIVRVQYMKQAKRYMTCCRDGTICYWSESFKLQRTYSNVGQMLEKKPDTTMEDGTKFPGTKHRWISDAFYLERLQKVVMASDDHHITFYEASTLDKCLSLDLSNTNALCLDYFQSTDHSDSMLFYGTDNGYINVFTFNEEKMAKFAVKTNGIVEHINIEKDGQGRKIRNLGSIVKRKVHNDWTVKLLYIPQLKTLLTCSPCPVDSISLIFLGAVHKWQTTTANIPKGVNAVAFCREPLAIISGGTDRILRVWNPHRMDSPVAMLKGHNSPITELTIHSKKGHLISLSIDKVVKIWSISNQSCLQTIYSDSELKPDNMISSLTFTDDEKTQSIVTTSSSLQRYLLPQKSQNEDQIRSHAAPIRCLLYNPLFSQIISGCDESVINIWDMETGQKTFRFTKVHNYSEITAMTFDSKLRRLLTGGRDGSIRIWNFNNGGLLQELIKNDRTEITGILYVPIKETTLILVAGWDRKITLFRDDLNAQTLRPIDVWPTKETKSWHSDDILSMVYCAPCYICSSSYSGDIIICNISSGNVFHHLMPHQLLDSEVPLQKRSIDKLLSLNARHEKHPNSACLLSCGGDGIVRFWNVLTGELYFEYLCAISDSEGIYAMISNEGNSILIVGDSAGNVSCFDISNAGISNNADNSIKLRSRFHAHIYPITDIAFIEDTNVILTSSVDCTIRLFTFTGQFIGILGQDSSWDINNPETFKFPNLPWDIRKINEKNERKDNTVQNVETGPVNIEATSVDKKLGKEAIGTTWFCNSLFAKESIKQRTTRRYHNDSILKINSFGMLRVYNGLTHFELGSIKTENKSFT